MNNFLISLLITLAVPVLGLILNCLLNFIMSLLARYTNWSFAYTLVNRVAFIGVVHHELSHLLLGVLTGAKPTKVTLFKPQGDNLGSVQFRCRGNIILRSIQGTLIAVAPTICGIFTCLGIISMLRNMTLPLYIVVLLIYVLVSVFFHMTMSKQDIKVMLKGYPIVFILILIVVSILNSA